MEFPEFGYQPWKINYFIIFYYLLFCRQVQCSVLRAWRGYVPVAKEEREREKRREQLRRKVASWLTDYQPSKHSTNVAEQ